MAQRAKRGKRVAWTKAHERELKDHSRKKTPVSAIAPKRPCDGNSSRPSALSLAQPSGAVPWRAASSWRFRRNRSALPARIVEYKESRGGRPSRGGPEAPRRESRQCWKDR